MASHFKGPLAGSKETWAGAGENLGIGAIAGDTDLITVFDDFDSYLKGSEGFGDAAIWEDHGWILTDDDTGAPTGDLISLNDASSTTIWAPSCLRIFTGTANDSGGNMQLDGLNGVMGTQVGRAMFPHQWIPQTGHGAAAMDNTVWVFACRIGLQSGDTTAIGAASGAWDSKAFIGWAAAGDVSVMDHDTGVLTDAVGNLHGFHIPEDGSIDGISKRITGDSLVDGTNFTEMLAAGSVDGNTGNGATVANEVMWFDLALRMDITNQSDNDANGATTFYHRRVPRLAGAPGARAKQPSDTQDGGWTKTSTVLLNETPNHSVSLVPTIEVMNGVTDTADSVFFLDWWAFGHSRFSR